VAKGLLGEELPKTGAGKLVTLFYIVVAFGRILSRVQLTTSSCIDPCAEHDEPERR
jgi:hypothetical protein